MKRGIVLFAISVAWVSGCATNLGPATRADGVLLTSRAGQRYVGDQLRQFEVGKDGTIGTAKDAWIYLYYTENRSFRLSGQIWLGGASGTLDAPEDLPDGFALFIREWDGLRRYAMTTRYVDVKRRRRQGLKEPHIVSVGLFQPPKLGAWIPFSLTATANRISFAIGGDSAAIYGPLDCDGANKIALAPGTRLKDLRLKILDTDVGEPQ